MKRFSNEKWKVWLSCILCLLPTFIGLALWNKLPDPMVSHYNFLGEPDGYSSKTFTVFALGPFMLAVNLLCLFGTTRDPRNSNVSEKIMDLILWMVPVVSLLVSLLIYGKTLGVTFSVTRIVSGFIAVLFMVIGNYLPKTRINSTIGVRLPWTVNDADIWNKTHRLSGYLSIFAGLAIALSLLLKETAASWVMLVSLLSMAVIPIVYSLLLYLKKKAGKSI